MIFIATPELVSASDCPESQRSCCYDLNIDLDSLAVSCLSPDQAEVGQSADKKEKMTENEESWVAGCKENQHQDTCGLRIFTQESNKSEQESSPGEFPWTCLILTAQNGFVGNCALIPGGNRI